MVKKIELKRILRLQTTVWNLENGAVAQLVER